LRDLEQQKTPRELCGGGDPLPLYFYIPMFPWKDFLMGWIRKIQKHKEERTDQKNSKTQGGKGQIRKFQKNQEGKNWRKEKEEIFTYMEVPIVMCVLNRLRTPSGYHPCATVPQENPLAWGPPLQPNTKPFIPK
jgi:hypothetical protein